MHNRTFYRSISLHVHTHSNIIKSERYRLDEYTQTTFISQKNCERPQLKHKCIGSATKMINMRSKLKTEVAKLWYEFEEKQKIGDVKLRLKTIVME
jgi:hypothetical protein